MQDSKQVFGKQSLKEVLLETRSGMIRWLPEEISWRDRGGWGKNDGQYLLRYSSQWRGSRISICLEGCINDPILGTGSFHQFSITRNGSTTKFESNTFNGDIRDQFIEKMVNQLIKEIPHWFEVWETMDIRKKLGLEVEPVVNKHLHPAVIKRLIALTRMGLKWEGGSRHVAFRARYKGVLINVHTPEIRPWPIEGFLELISSGFRWRIDHDAPRKKDTHPYAFYHISHGPVDNMFICRSWCWGNSLDRLIEVIHENSTSSLPKS